MKSRVFVVAFLLAGLFGASANAQDQYVQQLLYQLQHASSAFSQAGFQPVLAEGNGLNHQTYLDYRVTLNSRSEYAMIGVCDEDCYDLDLALLDGYGNTVAVDQTEDDAPLVRFQVTQTGDFTLRVTMYSCGVNPCYFGVGLYRR